MSRAWLLCWLLLPAMISCAPPLECRRISGDLWCELSGGQRSRPFAHRACALLGGESHGMWNEFGQPIGDRYCAVELVVRRRALAGSAVLLTGLLVVLRLRRRRR